MIIKLPDLSTFTIDSEKRQWNIDKGDQGLPLFTLRHNSRGKVLRR